MDRKMERFTDALTRADHQISQYSAVPGIALSLLIGAGVVFLNVSAGPLSNLNDIGGWRNRLLFLILCACAETLVQFLAVRLRPLSCGRMLLRQLLLACGLHIALLAINQKTYSYTAQLQPMIRAAEAGGLSALAGTDTAMSVPLLSLLYLLTRIPVYDMYLVKLLCIASYQVLALLFVHSMEESLPGLRAEALLLFTMILPQAFLSSACAAQADVFALLVFAAALLFLQKGKMLPSAALFGLSSALCGVFLLAAPLFLLPRSAGHLRFSAEERGNLTKNDINLMLTSACMAVVFYLIPMLPAILSGYPTGRAIASPLNLFLGVPPYASGSPNLMALFPRAAAMEMPESFLLRRLPALDLETNASPFYTQTHFQILMRGLALTGFAGYAAASFYAVRRIRGIRLAFILVSMALFAIPGGSMALWLASDLLGLALILTDRKMRLPSCLILFATAAGCCYPVTEEILIRPAYTALIVLTAILLSFSGQQDQPDKV